MMHPDLISIIDSHVLCPTEQARLSAQCTRILARLQRGPATNVELGRMCLNPRARISDLRAAGYDIACVDRVRATGEASYVLRGRIA